MINNDNIFAIEEYKPEQSTESTELKVYAGVGLSVLVLSVISGISDYINYKKDNKILKIIDKHLDIIKEPIKNDLKKFLPVYKKLTKNVENIIKKMKSIDKYGLYQPTNSSGEFENHGEPYYNSLYDDDYGDIFNDFAYDIIHRILYIVRGMKRKNKPNSLDYLKDEINNIKYRHSFIEGKVMWKLGFDGDQELSKDEEDYLDSINLGKEFNKIAEQITRYCKSISKNLNSLEVKPLFYDSRVFKPPVDIDRKFYPWIGVEIYLTMRTSITHKHLIEIVNAVKTDLYNKGNKHNK